MDHTHPAETDRRSDGSAGAPLIVPPTGAVLPGANAADRPNAALKEQPAAGEGIDLAHPARGTTKVIDAEHGLVHETAPDGTLRKKIAIVGFASSTRRYAPVHDPSWSIWGLNQLYRHIKRADRWFDIHWNWDQEVVPGTDHRAWARDCGMPFYLKDRLPDLPTAVRYPVEMLVDYFRADYFTSTIAYMLALAIWEIDTMVRAELRDWQARVTDELTPEQFAALDLVSVTRQCYARYAIGIFGVDLVVEEEYFDQKPCAEFWVGQATSRGITVLIPPESALCKAKARYGYQPETRGNLTAIEVAKHKAAMEAERNEQVKRLWMLEGAIETDERWRQVIELRDRGAKVE